MGSTYHKTTQIWWLANMKYKHSKLWLLCCCYCSCLFDVPIPASAHPFLYLDKWFVQIYLNVNFLERLLAPLSFAIRIVA